MSQAKSTLCIEDDKQIEEYKKTLVTEKLCPYKCQGMLFLLYTNETVKCVTCGKKSKYSDLLSSY